MQEDPEFVLKVVRSLYVDDLISGTELRQDSFEFYLKLKHRFAEGNMNMRKWNSNDKDLLRMIEDKEQALIPSPTVVKSENEIEEEDESFAKSLFNPSCAEDETKVLGLIWKNKSDLLKFDFSEQLANLGSEPLTKRVVLKTMTSLFDPLGLLAPLTVLLKLIFEDVCKGGHSWDEPLPKDIVDRWKEIISDIRSVGIVEINRHVLKNIDKSDIQLIELHGFGDGSSVAFAATIYL